MSDRKQKLTKIIDIFLSEETFCFYIVSCMILIPLGEFITNLRGVAFVTQPIIFSIYSVVGVFLIAAKFALRPDKRHWSDFFFFTSMIFMFLSLIYSKDIARAVRVDPNCTNEYPAYFLGYYSMMFAGFQLSSKKLRKIVLYTFIGISVPECILGIMQSFGFKLVYQMHGKNVTGNDIGVLTQNSNYFGGLVVLFLGAALGAALFTKNKYRKIFYYILSAACVYCSYATTSRSSWLGVGVMLITYMIIFGVMSRKYKGEKLYKLYLKVLVIGAAAVVVCGIVLIIASPLLMERVTRSMNEIKGLMSGDISHFGSNRGYIWTYCLEAIPKNWVIGVGLDNLYYVYTTSKHWMPAMYYSNRAHNVFLHILTTQGVFAFANYMAMLIVATVSAVKRIVKNDDEEDRHLTLTYFAMFVGYLAVAFWICRVFNVEMYFYITLGVMVPRIHKEIKA